MSRYLGIDYGEKRIGLSLSDPLKIIASDYDVLENDNIKNVLNKLEKIIKEKEVEKIILGFPYNMNGTIGFQAEIVLNFKKELEKFEIPIILVDERESSKKAESIMKELKVNNKKIRYTSDKKAASIILQDYLDYNYRRKNE